MLQSYDGTGWNGNKFCVLVARFFQEITKPDKNTHTLKKSIFPFLKPSCGYFIPYVAKTVRRDADIFLCVFYFFLSLQQKHTKIDISSNKTHTKKILNHRGAF